MTKPSLGTTARGSPPITASPINHNQQPNRNCYTEHNHDNNNFLLSKQQFSAFKTTIIRRIRKKSGQRFHSEIVLWKCMFRNPKTLKQSTNGNHQSQKLENRPTNSETICDGMQSTQNKKENALHV